MNPYADASTLLPGGFNDLAGSDPGWETYTKKQKQTVTITEGAATLGDVDVWPGATLRVFRQHDSRPDTSDDTPLVDESGDCGDDIEDLETWVNAGETLYFEFDLPVSGPADFNFGVCIHTPPNPSGGFHVLGVSRLETYKGGAFGADSFNNPAGVICAGVPSQSLLSTVSVKVRGVLKNGPLPGLLKLQLGPAAEELSPVWTVINWPNAGSVPGGVAYTVRPYHFYLARLERINGFLTDYFTTGSVTVTELYQYGPIFPSAAMGAGQYFETYVTVYGDGQFILPPGDGRTLRGLDADDGLEETPIFLESDTESAFHASGMPPETLTLTLDTAITADTMMMAICNAPDAYFGTVNAILSGGFRRPFQLYKEGGASPFGWTALVNTEVTLTGSSVLIGRPP